jgi:hypothetical protein
MAIGSPIADRGGHRDVGSRAPRRGARDGERTAIYLLIGFLAAWLVTMLVIQAVLIARHGYGSGIGGGQHVPKEIVKQIGVGNNLENMMKATNKP